MTATQPREETVRQTMASFMEAINALDADRIMSHFSDDATAFFPFARKDRANGKEAIAAVFRDFTEATRKTISRTNIVPEDLLVQLNGRSAVVTFNVHNEQAVARRTFVMELRGDRWLITHMHASNFGL